MKTVNDLIKELSSYREDLRELPVKVVAPNGESFEAEPKMAFGEYESPMNGDKPKFILITY